jgi:DNA-binding CsgD family transcriptional regulator
VTRDDTLAAVQTGFASLTDDELKVARLWLVGKSFNGVCNFLQMDEKVVRSLWRSMRRKLRDALKQKGHEPT